MSTRTSQRRTAIRQRRHLKREGFTDHEIQAFAQVMNPAPTDPDTTVLPPCEQDTR